MDFKQLQKLSHQIAMEKGFWESKERNLSELLMLIVTELAEACEALRHSNRQYIRLTKLGKAMLKLRKCEWKKDTFEDELADAVIRIMDLAESEGIDLEWQIQQKLQYNKTRPKMHGKEF